MFRQLTLFLFSSMLMISAASAAHYSNYVNLRIKPSQTDHRIKQSDSPHEILFYHSTNHGKLLLWLPGTHGVATRGPQAFFNEALKAGYRIISLSYINTPAVSQVCIGVHLTSDPQCAAHFRSKRIYGSQVSSLIADQPQDAINNRLSKLLRYLAVHYPTMHWKEYLKNNKPDWSKIVVAGQSQGGGMSAFIAKDKKTAGVISFSGGWDKAPDGQIAQWYSLPSATPTERWYGTYNAKEPNASVIAQSYAAMQIPQDHVFQLSLPVSRKQAHTNGLKNQGYQSIWVKMLGNGALAHDSH